MKKSLIFVTIALLGIMAGGCSKHHAHKKHGAKVGTTIEINLSGVTRDTVARNGDVLTDTLKNYVKVSIANGAVVTLRDAYILGINWEITPWAAITCEGDATIILEGSNRLIPFHTTYPGIFVPVGNTLTIRGDGSLDVCGRYSAAIGAGNRMSCGNIIIKGGNITATGYEEYYYYDPFHGYGKYTRGGAGIGSAEYSDCGSITITGGTICAKGGLSAPGIGCGEGGHCGNITITSAVTSVLAAKGNDAPNSIGAGQDGTCDGIIIEDPSKVIQQ